MTPARLVSNDEYITQLALKAGRGDQAALTEFVRLTQKDVWRLVAHLGGVDAADDLTQETYLRVMGALPRFAARSSARTWLLSLARRVWVDSVRHDSARPKKSAVEVENAAEQFTTGESWSELADARVLLEQLPEERREALILTQVLGYSYAEAAEIAGCRVGTIRSRVARARRDLVAALDDGDSAPTEVVEAVANTTVQPDTAETKLMETQTVDKQDGNERSDLPHTGANLDDARREQEDSENNNAIRKLINHPDWKTLTTRQKVRRILSAGGRARVSTIVLLVTLLILFILNLMTVETEDGPSGWLAPSRWSDRVTTQEEDPEESSAPQSSNQPTSTTQSVQPTETSQQTQTPQNQPSETSQQPQSTQNRAPSTATSTEPDSDQSNTDNERSGGSQPTDSTNNAEPNSADTQ